MSDNVNEESAKQLGGAIGGAAKNSARRGLSRLTNRIRGKKKRGGLLKGGMKLSKLIRKIIAKIVAIIGIKMFIIFFVICFPIIIFLTILGGADDTKTTRQEYTKNVGIENTTKYNDDGQLVATSMSFENKYIQAFYKYFSERSLWVTFDGYAGDSNGNQAMDPIKEPIQYNSKEYTDYNAKYGATEPILKDKDGRESFFYINEKTLYALDSQLNEENTYPEQFIKHIPLTETTDVEGNTVYELTNIYPYKEDPNSVLDTTGDAGSTNPISSSDYAKGIQVQSHKYKINNNGMYEKQETMTPGIWDYGFGSVVNYQAFEERTENRWSYSAFQVWDPSIEKVDTETGLKIWGDIVDFTYEKWDKLSEEEKAKYTVIDDFANANNTTDTSDGDAPSEHIDVIDSKMVYMINRAVTPAGTIENVITNDILPTGNQSIDYDYKTIEVHWSFETKTVNPDGTTTSIPTEGVKNVQLRAAKCSEEWKQTPKYAGNPNTTQLTGTKYFKDYFQIYECYVPNVEGDEEGKGGFDIQKKSGELKKKLESAVKKKDATDLEKGLWELLKKEECNGEVASTMVSTGDSSNHSSNANTCKARIDEIYEQYKDIIDKAEVDFGVSKWLILATIGRESSGHTDSVSTDGNNSKGLMQANWNHVKDGVYKLNTLTGTETLTGLTEEKMLEPEINIRVGTNLIRTHVMTGKGDGKWNIEYGLKGYAGTDWNNDTFFDANVYDAWKLDDWYVSEEEPWIINDTGDSQIKVTFNWRDPKYSINITNEENLGPSKHKGKKKTNSSTSYGDGTGGSEGVAFNINYLYQELLKLDGGLTYLYDNRLVNEDGEQTDWLASNKKCTSAGVPQKSKENQDYLIGCILGYQEGNEISDYKEITDQLFVEKYIPVFSNKEETYGNTSSAVDISSEYFVDGFDAPLGKKNHKITKEYSNAHPGVNLYTKKSVPVYSMQAGTVSKVGNDEDYDGDFIQIDYANGVRVIYGGLVDITVKENDAVTKGQEIGKTGKIGATKGLHFSISKDNTTVDPSGLIGTCNLLSCLDGGVGSKAVMAARTMLGFTYSQSNRMGANSADCSSLCYRAYKMIGINVANGGDSTAAGEAKYLTSKHVTIPFSQLAPGDLFFYWYNRSKRNGRFMNIDHAAMYVGNGQAIEASYSKGKVVIRNVWGKDKIVCCGRPAALVQNNE